MGFAIGWIGTSAYSDELKRAMSKDLVQDSRTALPRV
jgi:hypothetical protein